MIGDRNVVISMMKYLHGRPLRLLLVYAIVYDRTQNIAQFVRTNYSLSSVAFYVTRFERKEKKPYANKLLFFFLRRSPFGIDHLLISIQTGISNCRKNSLNLFNTKPYLKNKKKKLFENYLNLISYLFTFVINKTNKMRIKFK